MIAGSLVALRERRPSDVSFARAWFADAFDVPTEPLSFGTVPLTVVELTSGRPIGHAGLAEMSAEHRRALAWLTIGEAAYRGRGYGTDALRALCRYAFDTVNLAKVELEVVADNAPALALYERLGFVREVHRRRARWIDGAWRDEYLMGVFPEELR